ncbi:MAG: hypothetical protein LUG57_06895, partial [Oscillospiraceae bacterium]|nr:hypothetical protein [Oscillospiraceae bacterium]
MNIQPEALGALFEMSRDPVLGIQDNLISFANPAAAARLGLRSGDPARRALPDYILSDPSDRFITSIDINEQQAAISAARQDGFTLVYIVLQEEERPVPPLAPPSEEMGTARMSIKIAHELVVSRVAGGENHQL